MRFVAKIVALVLVVYFAAFVWRFDVFSSPVRNDSQAGSQYGTTDGKLPFIGRFG